MDSPTIQLSLHDPKDGHLKACVTCKDHNDFWRRIGKISSAFICICWIDGEPSSALLTYVPTK